MERDEGERAGTGVVAVAVSEEEEEAAVAGSEGPPGAPPGVTGPCTEEEDAEEEEEEEAGRACFSSSGSNCCPRLRSRAESWSCCSSERGPSRVEIRRAICSTHLSTALADSGGGTFPLAKSSSDQSGAAMLAPCGPAGGLWEDEEAADEAAAGVAGEADPRRSEAVGLEPLRLEEEEEEEEDAAAGVAGPEAAETLGVVLGAAFAGWREVGRPAGVDGFLEDPRCPLSQSRKAWRSLLRSIC